MDATPAEILSATLLAQLQALKHGELGMTPTNASRFFGPLWLHVRWDRDVVRESIPDILAALRVLAQLSRTNKSAWVQVLLELWPTLETSAWKQHNMHELDRMSVVGLRVECYQSNDLPDSITDRWLESKMDLSRGSVNETPVIPVNFYFCSVRGIAQTMEAIDKLMVPRGALLPRPYRVASLSFLGVVVDELDLHATAKVARHGVTIIGLSLVNFKLTTRNAAQFVTDLQTLMPPHSSHEATSTSICTMPISFTDDESTRAQLCVLSAIAASCSVPTLLIRCNRVLDEHVVRWLAFSLFTSCARHDLTQLSVMGEIVNARHAQVFHQVVQARDPVAELFTEHRSSVEAHESTRISASRFYLYGASNVAVECCQQTALRVITRETEWWSVLLPAWGRAWVHTDDAMVTTLQAKAEARSVRSPLCLALHSGFAEILACLEVVGHGFKELGIWSVANLERVEWSTLKRIYPNLKTLSLNSVMLDRLPSQHLPDVSTCWPLDTLTINSMPYGNDDPCQEVITLLRGLSSSDTDAAKTLRSLTITMTCTAHDYTPLVDAMLEMLNDNTRLRCLRLALPRGAEFRNETVSGICAQRGVPIHERQAPLGMRHKCSLIAAVVGQQGSWWDSNIWCRFFSLSSALRGSAFVIPCAAA